MNILTIPAKRKEVLLTACFLFAISFIIRYNAFLQTPYANGWDSYFYLIQIKALMEEGAMHSRDLSLIYPLMTGIQFIVTDYVCMYKITCSLLAAGFTVVLYCIAFDWTKDRWGALVTGCFTLFSPHLTYFSGQYPKNMLGIILFLLFMQRLAGKHTWPPLILLVLNFFGHRIMAVLSVAVGALVFLQRKQPLAAGLSMVGILILFLLIGIFLPGILSIADLERFSSVLSAHAQFAPWSFVTTLQGVSLYWKAEIVFLVLLHLLAILSAFKLLKQQQEYPVLTALALIMLFLIFPFLTWTAESIGFRLFMVYLLIAPLMLIVSYRFFSNYLVSVPLCVLLLCLSGFSFRSYNPSLQDPPYALYEHVSKQLIKKVEPEKIELIIAHKALAEYITFSQGIDAMPWIPEYEIQEDKLWRIVANVYEPELNYYLRKSGREGEYYKLSPSYFLLKESSWQKVMNLIRDEKDEELLQSLLTWRNPSKKRPYYLLKNKR